MNQNAIIRPNNPPPGIAGFVMDIRLEDSVKLESDITDHFVEDNTAVQDHIALRPEEVTVHGLVGEITQTLAQADSVANQVEALPVVVDMQPQYTDIQQAELDADDNASAQLIQAQTDTQSLDGYFNARSPQTNTKQSQAFAYFYQLWKGRQLFTVDTPWGFFSDMAIKSLNATQDQTTRVITDFSITFKAIRFAKTIMVSSGQLAGRCAQQRAPQTNNGQAGKVTPSTTELQSWAKYGAVSLDNLFSGGN